MASLQAALSSTSVPIDKIDPVYRPFSDLVKRMLGVPAVSVSLTHPSPIATKFLLGGFRALFRTPFCDMHLTRITPEHRAAALREAAMTHQCPYCVGHAAVLGDMFRGSMVQQCIRRGRVETPKFPNQDIFTQLIHEVCSFPGILTPETRAKFVDAFGEDGFRELSAVLSFMGFLNFIMSATGMKYESRLLAFTEIAEEREDIKKNLRENLLDDGEQGLGEEDVRKLSTPTGTMGWILGHLQNIVDCIKLCGPIISTAITEMSWYEGIPSGEVELDAWCLEKMGVLLGVMKNVDYYIVKRAIAFSLKLLFIEECPWSHREIYTFLYVFGVGVMNDVLKDDAVALYKASIGGGDDSQAGQDGSMSDLDDALTIAKGSEEATDRFSAALKYIYVCAGPGDRITKEAVGGLLSHVREHRDIVDLAGMVGNFGFLHRASVLYPARDE